MAFIYFVYILNTTLIYPRRKIPDYFQNWITRTQIRGAALFKKEFRFARLYMYNFIFKITKFGPTFYILDKLLHLIGLHN
jgi:hypothetical protein